MNTNAIDTEKLLRQVITSVAQLPPNDLLVVYETIADLKQKESQKTPLTSAEILARAKARAEEMKHLSHEEVVQRFIDSTERIRAESTGES